MIWSIVSTFTIGWFGSTAHTSFRSAGASERGSRDVRMTIVERNTPKITCWYGRYISSFGGDS
jgi:hypothetical protein